MYMYIYVEALRVVVGKLNYFVQEKIKVVKLTRLKEPRALLILRGIV